MEKIKELFKPSKQYNIIICWGCGHNFGEDEWYLILDNGDKLCKECFDDCGFEVIEEKIEAEA